MKCKNCEFYIGSRASHCLCSTDSRPPCKFFITPEEFKKFQEEK